MNTNDAIVGKSRLSFKAYLFSILPAILPILGMLVAIFISIKDENGYALNNFMMLLMMVLISAFMYPLSSLFFFFVIFAMLFAVCYFVFQTVRWILGLRYLRDVTSNTRGNLQTLADGMTSKLFNFKDTASKSEFREMRRYFILAIVSLVLSIFTPTIVLKLSRLPGFVWEWEGSFRWFDLFVIPSLLLVLWTILALISSGARRIIEMRSSRR